MRNSKLLKELEVFNEKAKKAKKQKRNYQGGGIGKEMITVCTCSELVSVKLEKDASINK